MQFIAVSPTETSTTALHVISAVLKESTSALAELELRTTTPIRKAWRILFTDRTGEIREHIVDEVYAEHIGGQLMFTVHALDSFTETLQDYVGCDRTTGIITGGTLHNASASAALYEIVKYTRWRSSTSLDPALQDYDFRFMTVREGIASLIRLIGGEVKTTITLGSNGFVSDRRVELVSELGRGRNHIRRRFEYGRNLKSCKRNEPEADPITALLVYGARQQDDTRINIASVNDGKAYVGGGSDTYKIPNTRFSRALDQRFELFVDDSCDDPAMLKEEALRYYEQRVGTGFWYDCSIAALESVGSSDAEAVQIGDYVQVVDDEIGLRANVRVTEITRDLLGNTADGTLVIGKKQNATAEEYKQNAQTRRKVNFNI